MENDDRSVSNAQTEEQTNILHKIQGLDLILTSINCQKYISTFKENGINEHMMLYLTADDLRIMDIDQNDVASIMTAVNVLKQVQNQVDPRLFKSEVVRIQSNIRGQLGTLAMSLNFLYHVIKKPEFEDMLIDDYLSAIDAAFMLRPYLRAELKETKTILKKSSKANKKRTVLLATTAIIFCSSVALFGVAFWRSNSISLPNWSNLCEKFKYVL